MKMNSIVRLTAIFDIEKNAVTAIKALIIDDVNVSIGTISGIQI